MRVFDTLMPTTTIASTDSTRQGDPLSRLSKPLIWTGRALLAFCWLMLIADAIAGRPTQWSLWMLMTFLTTNRAAFAVRATNPRLGWVLHAVTLTLAVVQLAILWL